MLYDPPKQVIYAFVDAANIMYRPNDLHSWKIDVLKLLMYLRERFGVSRVFYYGGVDYLNAVQVRMYEKMRNWGYELCINPVKRFVNEAGERYLKADVDSRMTFDMMHLLSEYDRAIVITGDGDFYWVLQYLLHQKEKVWLLSRNKKTAKELKKLFGGNFANFDNLRSVLEFTHTKKETDSTNDSVSGLTRLL